MMLRLVNACASTACRHSPTRRQRADAATATDEENGSKVSSQCYQRHECPRQQRGEDSVRLMTRSMSYGDARWQAQQPGRHCTAGLGFRFGSKLDSETLPGIGLK